MDRRNYTEEEKDFNSYDEEELYERRQRKEKKRSLRRQREAKADRPEIDKD